MQVFLKQRHFWFICPNRNKRQSHTHICLSLAHGGTPKNTMLLNSSCYPCRIRWWHFKTWMSSTGNKKRYKQWNKEQREGCVQRRKEKLSSWEFSVGSGQEERPPSRHQKSPIFLSLFFTVINSSYHADLLMSLEALYVTPASLKKRMLCADNVNSFPPLSVCHLSVCLSQVMLDFFLCVCANLHATAVLCVLSLWIKTPR